MGTTSFQAIIALFLFSPLLPSSLSSWMIVSHYQPSETRARAVGWGWHRHSCPSRRTAAKLHGTWITRWQELHPEHQGTHALCCKHTNHSQPITHTGATLRSPISANVPLAAVLRNMAMLSHCSQSFLFSLSPRKDCQVQCQEQHRASKNQRGSRWFQLSPSHFHPQ